MSASNGTLAAAATHVTFAAAMAAAKSHQTAREKVPNVFAEARNLALSDSDLDSYIDPSVTGSDRALAKQLMRFMPPNQRGDFVYMDSNGRLMSNNPEKLAYVVVSRGTSTAATLAQAPRVAYASSMRRMDYSSSCSPANPPLNSSGQIAAGGPYVRQVSQCGFTGAWAFVTLPCETSSFASGDTGYLYFELTGASQSHVESGIQYNNDLNLQPYTRSTVVSANSGYLQMTDGSNHQVCDDLMDLATGVISATVPFVTYTEVGLTPSNINPESEFISGGTFTPLPQAWLFTQAPSDMTQTPGTDSSGFLTPCTRCSISAVTSIAQGGTNTWNPDGSYFGVDDDGTNAIHWQQVMFGEWGGSTCNSSAANPLCVFSFSSKPLAAYGGPQYYPDDDISQEDYNPTLYGPYEAYAGIEADEEDDEDSAKRSAEGALSEPGPPAYNAPCTLDSAGYCATTVTSSQNSSSCATGVKNIHGAPISIYGHTTTYDIWSASSLVETATENITYPASGTCTATITWNPSNPSVALSDSSLP